MRWCWMSAAVIVAAVVSHEAIAAEQPGPRPDRPGAGPMVMFERLDRNKDGMIEASEVPDGAPEPIKQFLKRADRNDDKKISKDEFAAAMRAGPPMLGLQRPSERDARGRADGPPARDGQRKPEADRRGDRGPSDRPSARPEARDRGWKDRGPAGPAQWQGRGPQRGPVGPAFGFSRGPWQGKGPAFGPGRGPWQGRGPAFGAWRGPMGRGPAVAPPWAGRGPVYGNRPFLPPQAKPPLARGGKPSPVAHNDEVKQLQQKVKQLQHELKVIEAKLSKQSPPKDKEKPEKPAPKVKPPHGDDRGAKPADHHKTEKPEKSGGPGKHEKSEKPAKPEKHERK